jgi:hypothetical protein
LILLNPFISAVKKTEHFFLPPSLVGQPDTPGGLAKTEKEKLMDILGWMFLLFEVEQETGTGT